MLQHETGREHHRHRICDAFACDVGCRAMHRFEYCGVSANVRARRKSQSAHQASHFIRKNIAEQISCHNNIELPGVEHKLHGASIDNSLITGDAARKFIRHLLRRLQEDACQGFQNVCLVDNRDLLSCVIDRVVEGVFRNTARPGTCVHA